MTELVGIDHAVDLLDHAVGDVELQHADHAPFGVVHDRSRLAVDPGQPQGRAGDTAPAEQGDEHPHDRLPPGQRLPDRLRLAAPVPVGHHVGREHAEQRVHVAARGGLEEPAGEFLALRPPGRGRRGGARLPPRGDALAGAGEDLPAVHLGLADDPRHVRVAVPEHLAQHEHRPLHRREGLEQHEERHGQRVGQLGVLGRPRSAQSAGGHHDRLGQPVPHVHLPPHPRRTQVVDAQPCHRRGQVRLRIGDRGSRLARPGHAEECVLDDVLGVAHGSGHPVGDGEQQRPVPGRARLIR
jgi:hypothetical protein